jgi:ankyrin repeat protein
MPLRWLARLAGIAIAMMGASGAAASDLANLIEAGQRRAAIDLIEQGADVNEGQSDGTTPLHWAAYRVDVELTALLLEHGANPSAVNAYGSSPLGEAVKVGADELVELLLDAGADPAAPNADGQTTLMLAARSGSARIARSLIEHGVSVNARETWRGQSALIFAADARFPEIVDLLIDNGAEVDYRAMSIDWPSQITAEPRAQYRPVGGLTPLLYAARSGCSDCVRSIAAAGADIDRPTPQGMTPLMLAIDNEALDTAILLLELGANPHLWDWYGRTALYIAADKSAVGRGRGGGSGAGPTGLDVMQRLLEAGVDPNPQLNMHRPSRGGNIGRFTDDLLTTGCTPLLRVTVSRDKDAIELLLRHGAEIDLPNVMGATPLMAAAGLGGGGGGVFSADFGTEAQAIEIIGVLLAAGANVNSRLVGDYRHTGRIGRESSLTYRETHSALFAAVSRGWGNVVDYLLENGADAAIVDTRGFTTVDVARGAINDLLERDRDTPSEAIAQRLQQYIDGNN